MMRSARPALFVPVFAMAASLSFHAQSPAPTGEPSFEVVSIKPNSSTIMRFDLSSRPDGSFTMTGGTLNLLLGQAYPMSTRDMIGLPDWSASAFFDVTATAPAGIGTATLEQRRAMLRGLLADRFKLAAHYETREQQAFDLVLARSDGRLGTGLIRSDIDCEARAAAQRAAADAARAAGEPPPPRPAPPADAFAGALPPCSQRSSKGRNGDRYEGHVTMATLASVLRGSAGRVVVDKTGLVGYYFVTLESAATRPGLTVPDAAATPGDAPSIFTAVQEQLGLKLESSRAPVQVLVIDHVERPTEN
jgi:uncharacterized protein (TIGR03435 family)